MRSKGQLTSPGSHNELVLWSWDQMPAGSMGVGAQVGWKQGWEPVPAQRRRQLLISINFAIKEQRSTLANDPSFKKGQMLMRNILTVNVGQLVQHVFIYYCIRANRGYPWDGSVPLPLIAIYGNLRQLVLCKAFSSFIPFVPKPKPQSYTYYKIKIFLKRKEHL